MLKDLESIPVLRAEDLDHQLKYSLRPVSSVRSVATESSFLKTLCAVVLVLGLVFQFGSVGFWLLSPSKFDAAQHTIVTSP